MSEQEEGMVKPSEVVSALAEMASNGRYDNVTPESARAMNNIFDMTAKLINMMEAQESVPVSGTG